MKAFDKEEFLEKYWRAVLEQQADELPYFFKEDACIRWHNTREQFTVNEFIRANCEYPGEWTGEVERLEKAGDPKKSAFLVHKKADSCFFLVVSFIRWNGQ